MRMIIISLLGLLIAGCSRSGSAESDNAPAPVAEVRTAVATAGGAGETVSAYGIAEQGAGNENALTTQAEATLVRIVAPTGTAVGKARWLQSSILVRPRGWSFPKPGPMPPRQTTRSREPFGCAETDLPVTLT